MRMIYSTNNEESLLKSTGPGQITKSGILFEGPVTPMEMSIGKTTIQGKTSLFGKQIVIGKPHLDSEK
jgi:hypothetical protein